MSLNWEWKRQCGTITQKIRDTEHTFTWYEGNALMIVLDEFTDEDGTERYSMNWFFCDETHAKKCLGLAKGCDGTHNMLEDSPVTNLTIYRNNSRYWEKIVKLMTKAFPDLTVTILPKGPDT